MNRNRSLVPSLLVVATLSAACASTSPHGPTSVRSFAAAAALSDSYLARPDLENSIWAIRILRLDNGAELYTQHPKTSMVPASNTKLYTTSAAIDQLGPDFRFVTSIDSDGMIVNDTLRGNLIIRGSGDPSISGRFHEGDPLAIFRDWAAKLRELGINHIEGSIVGDDDLFDDLPLGYGWSWDDEPYWYSAEVGALTYNDNCVDFTITGTMVGQPAAIEWSPAQTPYITVDNQTRTVSSNVESEEDYVRGRASNVFRIGTTVHAGETVHESLAISNATLFFVHVLRSVLEDEGIIVDGYAVDIDDARALVADDSRRPLFEHASPPLSELITVVNKRSHNLYAEQILRVIGTARGIRDPETTSAELGIESASETWNSAGIDTSRIQLVDGSGLSRYNFVTAEMTSNLLTFMWKQQSETSRAAFLSSLPIGGVDGTIGSRFRRDGMSGRVLAKTGTVSNVSSLSGYVTTDSGIPLVFSIMANNFTVDTDTVRSVQDAIVTAFTHVSSR